LTKKHLLKDPKHIRAKEGTRMEIACLSISCSIHQHKK